MNASASPRLTPKLCIDAESDMDLRLDLPPLPRTVVRVSQLLAGPPDQVDAAQLAEEIDGDPVVASAVLRKVNSAYYGMPRRVGSVRKGVMLLGFTEIANLVLTSGLARYGEVFPTDGHRELFDRIMRVSIGAGQFARNLAALFELPVEGIVYSAGLLHGVGRLLFLYNWPDAYASIGMEQAGRALPTLKAERDRFGVAHTKVGAQAAAKWELPPRLVDVIGHYRTPEALSDEDAQLLAALVGVAVGAAQQLVARQAGLSDTDLPDALPWSGPVRALSRAAGVDRERIAEAITQHEEAVQRYVSVMMAG